MITPCFPRRLMVTSLFTRMPGDFSSTSMAVAPAFVGEASTLTMVRSSFVSIKGLCAVTVTLVRSAATDLSEKEGSSSSLPAAEKEGDKDFPYPTEEQET